MVQRVKWHREYWDQGVQRVKGCRESSNAGFEGIKGCKFCKGIVSQEV